ncbi:MAG TPA: hypothetical protein VGR71_10120 [Nitrospira sp.]|nr:hypothetical protein [Nitrospira sp.]
MGTSSKMYKSHQYAVEIWLGWGVEAFAVCKPVACIASGAITMDGYSIGNGITVKSIVIP